MKINKQNNLSRIGFFLLFTVSCAISEASLLSPQATNERLTDEVKNKKVTDWEARLEYARLLSNLQRYDESLIQYHLLLNEKPDSTLVQVEIAQVLYYQNKLNQALDILEKIPEKDINDKTRLVMAEIYEALKEYSKAESIYREQLKKMPEDSLTKLKLAELLSWEKRYEESVLLYRQMLVEHPNDIQLRRKYAMVLMWMGDDSEAAEELEKTLSGSESGKYPESG